MTAAELAAVVSSLQRLPGGVGMSRLRVYDSIAPDGVAGGSPHVHLVCSELYFVIAGTGAVEILTAAGGPRVVELGRGQVVYFTPGTIHRLVNTTELEILVVMANAGLPEAGDAVLTFPSADLLPQRYSALSAAGSPEEARARRDRAVTGFLDLRAAFARSMTDGETALSAFYRAAVSLASPKASEWRARLETGPEAAVAESLEALRALEGGQTDYLRAATVASISAGPDPALGMCGRLDVYLPEGASVG